MSSQSKCHRHKPPRLSWKESLSKPRLRSEALPGLGMWVSDNGEGGDLGMKHMPTSPPLPAAASMGMGVTQAYQLLRCLS